MLLKIVGHVYKLSRPRIMVTTLVGSQKTHNNSETHVLHTHARTRARSSLTEKPLETTLTESATFLKKFPDMSFSAHQGHREGNHSSLSPRAHSTTLRLRAVLFQESSSQQHTRFPPSSNSIPEDIAFMLLCRGKAAGKTQKGKSSPTWTPGGTQ